MTPLIPLSGSVLLNATAQISLRRASQGGEDGLHPSRRVWLGIWVICFVLATILWILALRSADISYAYPMLGAGYVLVTVLAKCFLGERISGTRWFSILVITAGVVIVGVNR
jgi:multidrug transporter EmrE-like cation transporter